MRSGWAASIALVLLVGCLATRKVGFDFHVFYQASARFRTGESPYQKADGGMPFKYSPSAALVLVPLSLINEPTCRKAWILISGTTLLACLWIWTKRQPHSQRGWAAFAALVLTWPLLAQEFFLGQCDLVLLGLVAFSEYFLLSVPLISGAALAIACFFKPPFLLLTLPLLLSRRWGAIASGVFTTLVFTAAGIVHVGYQRYWELYVEWREILDVTTPPLLCAADNQSLWGIACTYWAPPGTARYLVGVGAAMAILLIYGWRVHLKQKEIGTGFGLYLTSFLSPLGWVANLLSVIPSLLSLMFPPFTRGAIAALLLSAGTTLLGYDIVGAETFHRVLAGRVFAFSTLTVALVATFRSSSIRR